MLFAYSLRRRLFVIIVLPLLLVSLAAGLWRVAEARATAQDLYDRDLLFIAIAVSRDVALLDGDAISPETGALLSDATGGPVRYHVYAPDGVFVTGYAVPPIPKEKVPETDRPFIQFDGTYKGRSVRVLRMWDVSQIGGWSGTFTITVWQDQAVRQSFVRDVALRSLAVMAALIGAVAFFVWFGVNLGLKPLLDLQEAISRRTPDDLTPIRRKVPVETEGLVGQLNTLIGQIQVTLAAQTAFISDASHQLRNPIAGMRALGESILTAPNLETAKERARNLVDAAEHASNLANSLMTLERIRAHQTGDGFEYIDANELAEAAIAAATPQAKTQGVTLSLHLHDTPLLIWGDPVMLLEAFGNLVNNALTHGGAELSQVTLETALDGKWVRLHVSDNGRGIAPQDFTKVMARFGQTTPGEGSGLGLPISEAVAKQNGGELALNTVDGKLVVTLSLPLAQRPTA